MTKHTHVWRSTLHLDGCHQYTNEYRCKCGAARIVWAERSFRGSDNYSTLWALPDCERCQALLKGARRKPMRDITVMPDGTEIRNRKKSSKKGTK